MVFRKAIFIGIIVTVIMVSVDITLWLLATNGFFHYSLFIYTATIINLLLVISARLALKKFKEKEIASDATKHQETIR